MKATSKNPDSRTTMMPVPKQIRPSGKDGMTIEWDDGRETELSFRLLRKHCPCATCRQARERTSPKKTTDGLVELRVVSKGPTSSDPKLLRAEWVGNYALKLVWDDGHETGIYPFDYLLELAETSDG